MPGNDTLRAAIESKGGDLAMDNYIVRIYRRDIEDAGRIAGFVEIVELGEKRTFTGIEELIKILVPLSETRVAKAPGRSRKGQS